MRGTEKIVAQEIEQTCSGAINRVHFTGYKNKNKVNKVILSLNCLDVDLFQLKSTAELALERNNIEHNGIFLEL